MKKHKLFFRQSQGFSSLGTVVNIKRFYKEASFVEDKDDASSSRFKLLLDGRQIKTPNRNLLKVPTKELAMAIAHEFHMQREIMKPSTMPLVIGNPEKLSLSRVAIDMENDPNLRKYMIASILAFIKKDTICYREDPARTLGRMQQELLDPIVEFIYSYLSIRLTPTTGMFAKIVEDEDIHVLERHLDSLNSWKLTSMENAAGNMKSTSLALALLNNRITVADAVKLSRIEENYQIEINGKVEGAHDIDEAASQMVLSSSKLLADLSEI